MENKLTTEEYHEIFQETCFLREDLAYRLNEIEKISHNQPAENIPNHEKFEREMHVFITALYHYQNELLKAEGEVE